MGSKTKDFLISWFFGSIYCNSGPSFNIHHIWLYVCFCSEKSVTSTPDLHLQNSAFVLFKYFPKCDKPTFKEFYFLAKLKWTPPSASSSFNTKPWTLTDLHWGICGPAALQMPMQAPFSPLKWILLCCWSNYDGLAAPETVHHWSQFPLFVNNGFHWGYLEYQKL